MASQKSDTFLVYSLKSPEEARLFGLRGSDIKDMRPAPVEVDAASPEDWGFTSPNADGICKFCQLMLHPDAPILVQHQPNVQSLINSGGTCSTCKWLEISISRAPLLMEQYQEGDPGLCDENNNTRPLTVELTKHERFTSAVCWVGNRSLYTNHGVPLNITAPSRLGDLSTRRFWIPHDKLDSSESYERQNIIKNWLTECQDHVTCSASLPPTRRAPLPTRVIDLNGSLDLPSGPGDIAIKLRETNDGEVGTYIALSYCWGSDPKLHFKTTQANVKAHKEGIDFFSLPLVHREAILTTLYLGIRYIWIDSLCIIQDSREDWQAESVTMGSVYSNAHLTLAATSSSSPQAGLHNPFQGAETVDIHGETISVRFETHLTIDAPSEPLNTRGWTLQEAVLPSRLVCFGQEQWLWKCPSRHATEDGLIDGPRLIDNGLPQWAALVNESAGEDGKNYLRHWYELITNYSRRNLTYQSDKWNAIAGLTEMFIKQTGYTYLAGLWKEDLAAGLMWEATSKGVIREDRTAPSWSWLSVRGGIQGLQYRNRTVSMIELVKVENRDEGLATKGIGLTVKGRRLQVTLGKRSITRESRHHIIAEPNSNEVFGEAFLDSRLPDGIEMLEVTCLFVLDVADKEDELHVLLLSPSSETQGGEADEFIRLGMGVIWKRSKFYDDPKKGSGILERARSDIVLLV
ncbi:hypothetical protein FLONG3_1156 [Fusarium longipes]|uniref:Heterokaryon incompatibility domain-containing protein n=1 Tax=Fusarium longipes TaxID=694270 RepID=A0A395T7P6_9HYPO|nr:hypothetical protein FLONG3_1156 [Fusarium longipes]